MKLENDFGFQPVEVEIPKQEEFYKLPRRFGSVPVDEAPLGWETVVKPAEVKVTKFENVYPRISLPFQEVDKVSFGYSDLPLDTEKHHPDLFPKGANRLFFGDNLHVMRQLPSNSIDLIYIDPPFFSGRNYNILFGDKNEVRSFTDIWEGGMPGYLIWLNARLYEMKRLLKSTGSIYVHLDWHAAHYVKVEMDKIFGSGGANASDAGFKREIIWSTTDTSGFKSQVKNWVRSHDSILFYTKSKDFHFKKMYWEHLAEYIARFKKIDKDGRKYRDDRPGGRKQYLDKTKGKLIGDVWDDIDSFQQASTNPEYIGYPTQKREAIVARIIEASSTEGDVIADFFCGGGTTLAVAQRLNRRWIGSDQSRIAVAITADRITRLVEEKIGKLFPVPDFIIEHWGIYEVPGLGSLKPEQFREFVIKAYNGRVDNTGSKYIHGIKGGVPIYVGSHDYTSKLDKDEVVKFAKAILTERKRNHGIMLAWNFSRLAKQAAEKLAARENVRLDFVRLEMVNIESPEFRKHVAEKHPDYDNLLTFVQPPEIRVGIKRLAPLTYQFDVAESLSLNPEGKIINVQWDFDYRSRFSSTPGFSFIRGKNKEPVLAVPFKFEKAGKKKIACRVQDDQGGESTWIGELEVR
ncbi:MAG: site-specific DNA-methyltransferase [Thermodesulfovibrionales bacterium]|nr:site-specific DNA-methyltransferase [Thermodesulfovibrionales bacterium]